MGVTTMESWEIEYIKRNLKWLTLNTVCNSDLTEPLIAKGIIKAEDGKRLEDLLEREGICNAAKEFYRILMENSEIVDRFLSLHVKISGASKPFRERFTGFCRYDALAILKSAEMTKESLSKITTISIEQEFPKPRPLYIQRSISNRRKLDEKVFRVDCKDVFVFKGVDMNILEQLVGPHQVRLSSGQQSHVSCRHIFLEDDEDWDYMTLVCKHPMHLIVEEDGEFVLLRSTRITNTVINRLLDQNNNKVAFVSETDFVNQILTSKDGSGALICDIPGIGKTWFMESLAFKLQTEATRNSTAVFYMDFDSLTTHVLTQETLHDNDEALTTLLVYACKSKLGATLIQQQVQRGNLQLIFLLDGFDEISQDGVKLMISSLKRINEQRNVTLIISSRPNIRREMENMFNLVSFDIIPFESSEQIKYITGIWKNKHPDVDDNTLQNLANQCVRSTKYIQRNDNRDIFGVPLMCYILAENNEKFVEVVSLNMKPIQVPQIATITSVFHLYDTFVENCFQKLSNQETKERVFQFHMYKALDLLFPEISQCYLDAHPELSFVKINEILQPGVFKPGEEPNYSFIHRSFADYLAAKLFTGLWTNVDALEPIIRVKVQTFFIQRVLATNEFAMDHIRWKSKAKKDFLCFSAAGLTGIPKIPVIPFRYTTMLWFMDNMFCNHRDDSSQVTAVESFKKNICSPMLYYPLEDNNHLKVCKDSLRAYALPIVLACVEEKFTHICGLVGDILKAIFASNEINQIFTLPKSLLEKDNSKLALLLYHVAASGSIETCNQVFGIFDGPHKNPLLQYSYYEFPENLYSPIEIAIDHNDFEMFSFFFSKVKIEKERLFVRCFLSLTMSSTEIEVRIKILKVVVGSDESFNVGLHLKHIREYFNRLSSSEINNLHLLQIFSLRHKLNMYYIPRYCKTILLRHAILQGNDEVLLKLLICLFCKKRDVFLGFFKTATEPQTVSSKESETVRTLNANKVIEAIDLADAKASFPTMSRTSIKYSRNAHELESLKVLIWICPGMNYLHLAAFWEKLDWIKYLVRVKYNINQRDQYYDAPLDCSVQIPNMNLELTKILVESGAEVLAVDAFKQNVAHKTVKWRVVEDDENFNAFVNYTLENGFSGIWRMEDSNGITALEMLIEKIGIQHSIVMSILRNTNINYIAVHNRSIWRYLICNNNDEQILKQFLSDFPKQNSGEQSFVKFIEETFHVDTFEASEVLQQIEIYSAEQTVKQLGLTNVDNAFRNIHKVETLKLFLGVCKDFSSSNERNWNYMHFAVRQGKVEWLKYLLQKGHDTHQQDIFGCTPLLAMTWRKPVEVCRILVDNGADIYHVNIRGENVAHRILKISAANLGKFPLLKPLYDWLEYTLESGYEKLWDTEDPDGITALDLFFETILINDSVKPIPISTEPLLFLYSDDYRANIKQYRGLGKLDLPGWTKIVFAQKLTIQHVHTNYKILLLHGAIEFANDKQLIQLLLLLFPNFNVLNQEITNPESSGHSTCFGSSQLQAETILDLLNIIDAEQHFGELNLDHHSKIFTNLKELETLKVLIRLCSDLTQCTREKVNYLHAAAAQGNICWAEYLMKAGHDVNQLTYDNEILLHFISTKNATAITKTLIKNGANPFALDECNFNVAHRLLMQCRLGDECVVQEWVEYMQQQNYDVIWLVKYNLQYPGKTPYDMLSKMLGAEHPTTKSVFSRLVHKQDIFLWGEKPYVQHIYYDLCVRPLDLESTWEYSDEKFLHELLKLYGRCDRAKCRYGQVKSTNVNSKSLDPLQKAHNFLAEEILECIDVELANETLSKVHLGDHFLENINSLETLKILLTICPDFKKLNAQGGNYLHYAVRHGRVHWVDYLISMDNDVNELDKHGFTPILCISPKNPLKLARLLVDNGCDAFVHDNVGENFVDKLRKQYDFYDRSIPDDMIEFIKEKGLNNLLVRGT